MLHRIQTGNKTVSTRRLFLKSSSVFYVRPSAALSRHSLNGLVSRWEQCTLGNWKRVTATSRTEMYCAHSASARVFVRAVASNGRLPDPAVSISCTQRPTYTSRLPTSLPLFIMPVFIWVSGLFWGILLFYSSHPFVHLLLRSFVKPPGPHLQVHSYLPRSLFHLRSCFLPFVVLHFRLCRWLFLQMIDAEQKGRKREGEKRFEALLLLFCKGISLYSPTGSVILLFLPLFTARCQGLHTYTHTHIFPSRCNVHA